MDKGAWWTTVHRGEKGWTWRSNQSILKEISPGCSLEGLRLKLKLQFFGHLMQRPESLEKTLMLGKIEGRGEGDERGWDGWMASLTRWTWVWVNSGNLWWTRRPGVLRFMGSQRVEHDWATELNWKPLSVCTTTNCGKLSKRWKYQTTWPASWEICMQVKKQQLEPDMEQRTGSKLGKEFVKAVYCHLAYLTSMQST